jgi:hypothetical protein
MRQIAGLRHLLRRCFEQSPVALLLVAGAALLGGCEGLKPAWDPQPIEASKSVIRFEHDDFDPKRAEYLLQHDPRSGNDVYFARFVGDDAFAMLAAFKTGPGHVIENRATESYVGKMLDAELTWGESGVASTRQGSVPYRMFTIAGQPMSCVGFGHPRGESSDDRGRKSNLVFGYFCEGAAQPMSAATADDLISKVSLGPAR